MSLCEASKSHSIHLLHFAYVELDSIGFKTGMVFVWTSLENPSSWNASACISFGKATETIKAFLTRYYWYAGLTTLLCEQEGRDAIFITQGGFADHGGIAKLDSHLFSERTKNNRIFNRHFRRCLGFFDNSQALDDSGLETKDKLKAHFGREAGIKGVNFSVQE